MWRARSSACSTFEVNAVKTYLYDLLVKVRFFLIQRLAGSDLAVMINCEMHGGELHFAADRPALITGNLFKGDATRPDPEILIGLRRSGRFLKRRGIFGSNPLK